ncbi:hypothetical protein [Klebsiella pneumoniae]|uniref:hypothetical protein n=1 Tax=Klebsiella pneumoniae TaxID=573 RepID=UPI0022E6DA5B|nr:hypothetical protein [Klebsiella pneumoniae]
MATTDTQQTAQFAAEASVSAAEAKQYLIEVQQGYQDISATTQEAINAATAAEAAKSAAETAEQNSSTSAAASSESATAAAVSAAQAEEYKNDASEYALNKFTFYKTPSDPDGTIAGLAATTNGQSFRVAEGPGATAAFKTYENQDGVAVLQASQPGTAAVTGTIREFPTLAAAQADADAGNIPVGSTAYYRIPDDDVLAIEVINNGGTLEATGRKMPSQAYIDAFNEYFSAMSKYVNLISGFTGSSPYPIAISKDNNIILGYNEQMQALQGLDMQSALQYISNMSGLGVSNFKGNYSSVIPIVVGNNNNIILGYDVAASKIVGLFPDMGSGEQYPPYIIEPLPFDTNQVAINYIMSYGQSLSIGVEAGSLISIAQPYSNKTFGSGVRGNGGDFSSQKPLVEDDAKPTPDGSSTPEAETVCSGMANYASLCAYRENGVLPADHVIFSSAAGHGSYTIAQLSKGSSWYNSEFLNHIHGAKNLNSDIALHAIAWLQGETDSTNPSHTQAQHLAALLKLQVDVTADAQAITGQTSPVMFLTYQHSSRVKVNDAVPLALLDACQVSDYFYFVAPTYPFPHAADGLHLLALGYKWIGAYYGRAYKQAVIDGIKPKAITPKGVIWNGDKVTVQFEVPNPPLVFDTTNLAPTQNYGFSVYAGGVLQSISSIEVSNGNSVVITLGSAPTTPPKVCYAFDYLGSGLNIQNGASGNLRDSNADTCVINGDRKPLFYICPHFKLDAITEEF